MQIFLLVLFSKPWFVVRVKLFFTVSGCWNAFDVWGLGGGGDRWRSLDGALHSFLRLRVRRHSMRGLGGRGSRGRGVGNTLCSFPRPPCFQCVPTPEAKKLWSAPPKHHHQLPQRPRPRIPYVQHLEAKNYGVHHLDIIIGNPVHLDHVIDASWDLYAKNHKAHYLDSIIGHPIDLDHEFDVFQHL